MIIGTKRPVPEKKLRVNVGLHNRFDIEVRDAATGELKQQARAFNVICDTLWDKLLYVYNGYWYLPTYNYFYQILYGSGTGTPAASDTALFNQLGYRTLSNSSFTRHTDVLNGIAYVQASVTLQAGDNVGDTLTEVGIGYGGTTCATHAMLEDMNGNPISIEKTATDVITIYATIYLHWSPGGWANGSIFIADNIGSNAGVTTNTTWDVVKMLAGATGYQSSLHPILFRPLVMGPVTTMQNGNMYDGTSNFLVNKSAKKVTAAYRYNVADGNVGIRLTNATINTDDFTGQFCRMLSEGWYTPADITGEAVGTGDGSATVFKTAFPVKTAGTVKVNGAAQSSGVTMRTGAINRQNAAYFLRPVAGKTSANTILYTLFPAGMLITTDDGYTVLSVNTTSAEVVENPFYTDGITELVIKRRASYNNTITIEASDDLATWTAICTDYTVSGTASTVLVPAALQNNRFFRLKVGHVQSGTNNYAVYVRFVAGDGAEGNIIFSTPPAAGAVITADYTPDCIAKDEDHVFDLTLEITFGEYQEV